MLLIDEKLLGNFYGFLERFSNKDLTVTVIVLTDGGVTSELVTRWAVPDGHHRRSIPISKGI